MSNLSVALISLGAALWGVGCFLFGCAYGAYLERESFRRAFGRLSPLTQGLIVAEARNVLKRKESADA